MRGPKSMLHRLGDWLARCKSQVVRKFGLLRTCVHAKRGATTDTSQLSGHTRRDKRTEAAFERLAKFMRTPSQDIRLSAVPGAKVTMCKNLAEHGIYTVVQLLGVYYTFCDDQEQFREILEKMCKVTHKTSECMLEAIGEKAEMIRRSAFPNMSKRKLQKLGRGLMRKTRKPSMTARRVGEM